VQDFPVARLPQLRALRDHVRQTLCEIEHLDPLTHVMTECLLVRGGTPCGLMFCLFGPRQVRLQAVWDFDRDAVRYYDSAGRRVKTRQRRMRQVEREESD